LAIPYGFPGFAGAPYLGYPDDAGTSDGSQGQDNAAGPYDAPVAPPAEQDQPLPPGSYRPAYGGVAQGSPALEQDEVTLVFKDGRPTEQIHNFVLTSTTLYVGDRLRRSIPTDQLDLEATAKVNRDAGVEFLLPTVLK
jgi:hypothetical protein